MSLNVQWRWNMPTVGDPDKVAAGNRQDFLSGLDSIASGLIKSGENKRADEKQKWLEDTTAQKFAHQVAQDRLAQMNTNRNYMLQRDIFNQNKKRSDFDMNRQGKLDEWLQKFYEKYFGDTPDEIERIKLLEELQSLPGWQDLL